ncbi:MAG: membrane protein insertion efficiency factor YidD [Planctomycetes bacterium]|nr:membrane protein insertion efficiency factor YidD [Planctomycetota bacterium]
MAGKNNNNQSIGRPDIQPVGLPGGYSAGGAVRRIILLPRLTLILMVRLYQWTLSPLLGRQCRFIPTCSSYMIQSLQKYGAIKGTLKGLWRLIRCNPFCKGGYDPVE